MNSKWSSKSCERGKLKKGPWTFEEDIRLLRCIKLHGPGRWNALAKASGLQRCGKSCRLRWVNYLRPDLKRGSITPEEERLILDLHARLGNRWSLIAEKIPGRTDNEIKNFWRSRLRKQRLTESQVGHEAPKVSSLPLVTASQTQPLLQAGEYRNDNYVTQVSLPPNFEGYNTTSANLNEQSCGAVKGFNIADNAQHGAVSDSAGLKWEPDEGYYYRGSWPEQDNLTAFLYQLYLGLHVGDDVAPSNPSLPTNTAASSTMSVYLSDDGDQSDTCLDLDVSGTLWNPIRYMS